uniref:Transcriptional regulator n=1 Tax=Staphylococcus phage Pel11 TaxID=3235046 RepID=A0AB39C7U6_9CAUD
MHTVLALHRNGEKPTITSHDEFEKSKMEQAYQRYKTKRKEKPWLTTVPQSVKPSRAYYDLCDFVGVPVKQKEIKRYEAKPKEKKLPKIPGDHSREFMINGYVVSVRQLAKLLDMRYEVVDNRLRNGVTPEELLEKKGVKL